MRVLGLAPTLVLLTALGLILGAFQPVSAQRITWLGISPDGSVIVGYALGANNVAHAFRWTQVDGIQDLGPGFAHAVSEDGTIIVGNSNGRAFIWTQATGMQDLNTLYATRLRGSTVLGVAINLSPDGRYIVGDGYHELTESREAFLLDTDSFAEGPVSDIDRNFCVDDSDLMAVLFASVMTGSGMPEDTNHDDVVDDADLLQVLFDFGEGC
ncbi:MAG: hypothetical protein KIT45_02930 [Fimbriimonadia bacterium]|nr:hypothetical protein [Fimbriimonadia bacterium]